MATTLEQPQTNSYLRMSLTQDPPSAAITGGSRIKMSAASLRLLTSIGRIEKQEEARKLDVAETKNVAAMLDAFLRLLDRHPHNSYTSPVDAAKGITPTNEELNQFCAILIAFQNEREFGNYAGRFLSALINNSKDSAITLDVTNLKEPLYKFCSGISSKKMTVFGNVGGYFGESAASSDLIVFGDADFYLGHNLGKKSTITVHGNASYGMGYDCFFANIRVFGKTKVKFPSFSKNTIDFVISSAILSLGIALVKAANILDYGLLYMPGFIFGYLGAATSLFFTAPALVKELITKPRDFFSFLSSPQCLMTHLTNRLHKMFPKKDGNLTQ